MGTGNREPRETVWSACILSLISKKANGTILSVHGHEMQAPGWPDSYISHKYWKGWIEFKGSKTRLTDLQKMILSKLGANGDRVYIVRYPNLIQHYEGVLLTRFTTGTTNDGISMLKAICAYEKEGTRK